MISINVIAPYKVRGDWVFDDPRVEQIAFPLHDTLGRFVDLAREAHLIKSKDSVTMFIADGWYPSRYDHFLFERRDEDESGVHYYCPELHANVYFRKILLAYFTEPPEFLHVQVMEGVEK